MAIAGGEKVCAARTTATLSAAPASAAVDAVVERITEVSTLPHIAARVITVANDPTSGAAQLCAIIRSDPAATARLLRVVNSAASGLRTTITDLQHAISMLGFARVRNLIVASSVARVFNDDRELGLYNRRNLWRHMVSVGVVSQMVAARLGLANFAEVFLAGLLHDVGLILEDQYCHAEFAALMSGLGDDTPLVDAERRTLGFDHAELGQRFAVKWQFPATVVDAITHHHAADGYVGEHRDVVCCVELANFLCSIKGITSVGIHLVAPPTTAAQVFKLTRDQLEVFLTDMDTELEQYHKLMGM